MLCCVSTTNTKEYKRTIMYITLGCQIHKKFCFVLINLNLEEQEILIVNTGLYNVHI
jgi:hypothetical protein